MMASTGRVLLNATVTDVGIGPFVYPACGQCYSKLIQLQDCRLHRCQNCGRSYNYGQEQFRYRLCLTVTDGTALASLTTFGGMLNVFFGVPATEFHNILMSSATGRYGASYGSIIQVAVEQAFIGQRLLFGVKTLSSNTRQTQSRYANGHSAISLRDICQSSITSSQKSMGGHLPDFIAVQIMPVTDSSFSATVVDCFRQLESIIEECNLTADAYADRAALLQLLHLRSSSNGDKCSFSHSFTRHAIRSPTANPFCDGTIDSSFDQSSLAFSCDDSLSAIFVPKRPGLTACTSKDPELTVCLPDWPVSVGDQGGECGSHRENGDSVMCDSLCDKDEIGHSQIRNCLTIQQTGHSAGMLKTCGELVGARKCKTRSTDNCINSKLYDEYKNIQKCGKRHVNRSKVKVADGQCDTDRHKKKTFCDQSDMTKCEVNIACDHCGVKKHTVKRACGHSVVGRHNVKTICDQRGVNRHDMKTVCDQRGVNRHDVKTVCDQRGVNRHDVKTLYGQTGVGRRKIKTICSQNDVNRLACVSASTNHKHKHGYVKGNYTNQDIVNVENKENVSQNVDTITTSCQIQHPLLKPAASSRQLSVQYSPISVNKAFLRKRNMLKKRFSERHGFSLGVSLNTEAEELAATSCPGDFKDHSVEMAGLSDSRKEMRLSENFSEQSLPKTHSKHNHLRLSYSDQSTIDATSGNKRFYHLARDADEKHKAQRYSKEIGASENILQITEFVEDIPEELMEGYASKVMGDCLSKLMEVTPSKLWEDYPESAGLDVFLSKIREDSQSNLMEGISSKLMDGISSKLRDDNPSILTDESASKLREDYPKSDAVFLANLRENNTSQLVEDYPSELMEDYPEFENLDVILSPTRGDNLSQLREVSSSTLMEVYPESEEFGTFLSRVKEDNPSKLMKAYPSELTKDYPQPEGQDICLLSVRGDNPSQLRDGCTLNLMGNYPSKLMEDYAESEGLDVFLTKLNSSTTDRSDRLSMAAEKGPGEMHMKKWDDTAAGCTDHRTRRMSSMLHSSTNDHRDFHSRSMAAEKTTDGILSEQLHGIAAGGHDYRKGMSSNPHCSIMLECEIDGCETEELGASAVRLPSLVLVDSGHFETPKKQILSLLFKTSQKQRTVQGGKSCKRHGAFRNMTTRQKRDISHDDKNSRAQSTPRHIHSSGNHGTTQNTKIVQAQGASRNTKALVKQDVFKKVKSIKTQGSSMNTKALKNQDFSKNVKSVKKQNVIRNYKSVKKQGMSPNDENLKKQALFQAVQMGQKAAENVKDLKTHKLRPNINTPTVPILFLAFENHEKTYTTATVSKACKVGDSDVFNGCEKLTLSKTVRNLNKETLCQNVTNAVEEMSLQNVTHSAEPTLSLPAVNSIESSDKCNIQKKQILGHSEKQTLAEKVTSGKKFVLPKSCQNQERNTLPQLSKNVKKNTFLQSGTHSGEQAVILNVTTQKKWPSQHTIPKSKKHTLSVNLTSPEQILQNVKTSTKGEFFPEYTTPMEIPQQNRESMEKMNLSVNSTNLKQTSQKVESSVRNIRSLKYKTPQLLTSLRSCKDARRKVILNHATPKQTLPQIMKNVDRTLSYNYVTPKQTLPRIMKNADRTLSYNYVTPKQTLPRIMKNADRTLSYNYVTPKQTLPRIMKNADRTLSSNYATRKQTLPRIIENTDRTLTYNYVTPKQTLPRIIENTDKTLSSNYATRKQTLQRNVNNSEKTVSSNNTTPGNVNLVNKRLRKSDVSAERCKYRSSTLNWHNAITSKTIFSDERRRRNNTTPNEQTVRQILTTTGEYISSASDTTSKYPISQQNVTNSKHSTLTKSSKTTKQGILKLTETTPATDYYNTQSIDLNSWSVNVTLRRSKRKCHTDKIHETNNTTITRVFAGESTNTETLCFGRVSDDECASAENPTGKMSRLSHVDPRRESGDLFQITDSLFHAHSGLNDMESDRKVWKDSSIMSDRSTVQNDSSCKFDRIVQNDSSCKFDRIVQKDSSIMSDRRVQNDSSCKFDRIVQKDSSIMSDRRNVQNDSRCMFDRIVQKDSTNMSDRNVGKDNTSISDKSVQKDNTSLSHNNIQNDRSCVFDRIVQKDSRSRSHRIAQKDSNMSHLNFQKDTTSTSDRNVGKDNTSISDKTVPKGSTDRPLQSSISGRKSTVHDDGHMRDDSTIYPDIPQTTWQRGCKQSSSSVASLVSFMQETSKSACVVSEVFPPECALDSLSGPGDYRLGESFCPSDNQSRGKDKFAGQQVECLRNSGCNTDTMDVDSHVTKIIDLNDRAAEMTDKYDVAEITDMKGRVTEIMDMKGRVTEITDKYDVAEITDTKGRVTEITDKYDVAEITDMKGRVTEITDKYDVAEITDMKGHVPEIMDTNGHFKGILNVTDNVAEITDIGDCLTEIADTNNDVTEITDMNNRTTKITDFNDSVTKITDMNNHSTEIVGVNNDTAEITDKNDNVTGMSLLKDFSGSCEAVWDCPGYDVSDDSSVGEHDVRGPNTGTTQRLDVEVCHVRGECTEQHIDYGHLSAVLEEALYPQREHDKRFICATCPKRARAISLNCDSGLMKAAVDSGLMKASVDSGLMKASVDSGLMKASVDSGLMKASVDSGLMKAAVDSGLMKASVDSGLMKASVDSGLMKPAVDSGLMKASVDSGLMKASVDSGLMKASVDSGLMKPAIDSGLMKAAVDSGLMKAAVDSGSMKAAVDSGLMKASVDLRSMKASVDSESMKASVHSGSMKASVHSGSMKASVHSGMCPKRLEITAAASDAFSPQANPHLAEDVHEGLSDSFNDLFSSPEDVHEGLTDSFNDLFSSPEDGSVFVSQASQDNEFGRETCQNVVQKSWLLPKSNMVSARLCRSGSESTGGASIASLWQREICGDRVQETLLVHQAYPTSDECQRSSSKDRPGNVSEICQVAKQVRFSNTNREHNYFACEAISHQPVVIQNMPYLKSSLKKSDAEWEPAGSQDLFSEPSPDLAVSNNVSMQVEPGHRSLNDEWNSSCELFSQTPEQPSRKCALSAHHATPVDRDQSSIDTNTPRISRIGGVIICAQSETLLSDHSFDLFTPSPSNRNKVNSVSLFSPEVCNHPTQLCITPDLFS